MVSKNTIQKVLKTIPDPEIGVSLYDLGLVYNIKIKGVNVEVLMTLTTIGCPLFEQIEGSIRDELMQIKGVKKVKILLTFEPPWKPDMMSKEAKMQLGFN